MLSRLLVAALWLLHFLPLSVLAACGNALGSAFFALARRRRHIVLVNLRLCFPERDDEQRRLLAKAHFRVLGRSVLERSLLLWARPERLSRLIRVEGEERMRTLLAAGRPVLMLTPHFVGLDAGGDTKMIGDGGKIGKTQSAVVLEKLIGQFLFDKAASGNGGAK